MKLKKVISGGQTGADRTALEEAKKLGLETGGIAPRGFWTEIGPDLELRDLYGLTEDESSSYVPRTRKNVLNAEATVWFGLTNSPGFDCTYGAAIHHGKRDHFYANPDDNMIKRVVALYEVVNFAGNRKSGNPKVVDQVRGAFDVIRRCREEGSS